MCSLEAWHAPNYHILVSLEDTCLFFCNTSIEAAKTCNSFQRVGCYCSVTPGREICNELKENKSTFSLVLFFFSSGKKMFYIVSTIVKVNQAE